jgi:hypothetical protein
VEIVEIVEFVEIVEIVEFVDSVAVERRQGNFVRWASRRKLADLDRS